MATDSSMGFASFSDEHIQSDFPISSIFDLSGDIAASSSPMGFMDLLGFHDFGSTPVLSFPTPTPTLPESSDTANLPATPNSPSMSSTSTEEAAGNEEHAKEETEKMKKLLKPRSKKQKAEREPRFAFVTKSEVDHLEDGYRWRKYGQKAVKNSPFPRSYYRCTTVMCGVKKRVERSSDDPTVVVTTYEGKHTHPSPVVTRGNSAAVVSMTSGRLAAAAAASQAVQSDLQQQQQPHPNYIHSLPSSSLNFASTNPALLQDGQLSASAVSFLRDYGLLQDIIP
ncbi:hypothetical protein ACLOJK_017548 [Asimina triloba]